MQEAFETLKARWRWVDGEDVEQAVAAYADQHSDVNVLPVHCQREYATLACMQNTSACAWSSKGD